MTRGPRPAQPEAADEADEFAIRHVPFEACFNFRDIGGYETRDGRRVRWGRVFRSGALHRMTAADVDRACNLGIASVIDLRRPDEVREGAHVALDGVRRLAVPIVPEGGSALLDKRFGPGISAARYAGYLELGGQLLPGVFEALADPGTYATVIHCSAGKDRTGTVVAMLLDLLGVDRETIVRDYELTNREVERQYRWLVATGRAREDRQREGAGDGDESALRRALGVPAEAIEGFLDRLHGEYGSAEGYLRAQGLGAGIVEAVRAHLLEPVAGSS